jgi:glutamine synthetase
MIAELQGRRAALGKVTAKAEGMHDSMEAQATLLTTQGADRMADVRESSDALELVVSDELWPLPKYREMVFPV